MHGLSHVLSLHTTCSGMVVLYIVCYRYAGQVGYILCNMKKARDARVGDTLYHTGKPVEPYPGFKPIKPVVST